jgi:hypothetical protein
MDYLDEKGLLTLGFGVIAWPAKYGNSGLMPFLVNHRGLVFETELGPETTRLATDIDSYNPGPNWVPTEDSLPAMARHFAGVAEHQRRKARVKALALE